MTQVRTLKSVVSEGLDDYAGFFVPGGVAPVVDIMQDPHVGEILRYAHSQRRPAAMLCHGPIAVVAAMPAAHAFRTALMAGDDAKAAELAKGWQYTGYRMTIFSNTEEKWLEDGSLHGKMYFHVADALTIAGGDVSKGATDFGPHVVEDRELITGQNPCSDHLLGMQAGSGSGAATPGALSLGSPATWRRDDMRAAHRESTKSPHVAVPAWPGLTATCDPSRCARSSCAGP